MPFIKHNYYCSVCQTASIKFRDTGIENAIFTDKEIIGGGFRRSVVCPVCGANDRIRWIDYVFENFSDIYKGKNKILHIAPETSIAKKIRKNPEATYITGDICEGLADEVVDVTKMQFADQEFDYIILNHVMEHIKDEKAAMSEIHRCLKPDGCVWFSAPICESEPTLEYDEDLTAEERLKHYGQKDHVRLYGNDIVERLGKYGFDIKEYLISDYMSESEIEEKHFMKEDRMYCGKRYK
ncbi:MAG: methyltransferase domain-containing protein [Lachnospiraceae bacterium]|nr:methyltransferase domain-containing protein [Lachnospiraceae bacterium]